jgi:hypothetical protein
MEHLLSGEGVLKVEEVINEGEDHFVEGHEGI